MLPGVLAVGRGLGRCNQGNRHQRRRVHGHRQKPYRKFAHAFLPGWGKLCGGPLMIHRPGTNIPVANRTNCNSLQMSKRTARSAWDKSGSAPRASCASRGSSFNHRFGAGNQRDGIVRGSGHTRSANRVSIHAREPKLIRSVSSGELHFRDVHHGQGSNCWLGEGFRR
jgi:hypothetical protein